VESPAVVGAGESGAIGVEVRQVVLGDDGRRRVNGVLVAGSAHDRGGVDSPAGVETDQVVGAGLEALEAVHVVGDDPLLVVGPAAGQQVVPRDLGGVLARQEARVGMQDGVVDRVVILALSRQGGPREDRPSVRSSSHRQWRRLSA
jgi:hypothetical protein